jgi:hypothetical protein
MFVLANGWPVLPDTIGLEHRVWRAEGFDGAAPRGLHRGRDQLPDIRLHEFGPPGRAHRTLCRTPLQVCLDPEI